MIKNIVSSCEPLFVNVSTGSIEPCAVSPNFAECAINRDNTANIQCKLSNEGKVMKTYDRMINTPLHTTRCSTSILLRE